MRRFLSRLTTRRMIVLVTVLAVPLAFWAWRLRAGFPWTRRFDFVPIGISAVALFLVLTLLSRADGRLARLPRPIFWGVFTLNLAMTLWFTSVEWFWIQENCPRCGHVVWMKETRFFSTTTRREIIREFPRVIELMAVDLGIACTHPNAVRLQKQHWIGGCLPAEINDGISVLSDPPWYPPCARDAIRTWAADDPNFVATFRSKVLDHPDRAYLANLFLRLHNACPGDRRSPLPSSPGTDG